MVNSITLESVLNNINMEENYSDVRDLDEITLECMEIADELSILERNLTTYEAAKMIKKAKSASTKKKIVKTKMKAKDAKAKKAGGKVVKITKEADATVDGGTGPLPTTSDTNGLTDTDLEADPEADVQVTEVVDDDTPQDQIVGTEGVDFMVEYEDADILRIVMEEEKQKGEFGAKIKQFIDKVIAFIKSVCAKIADFFNFNKKFLTKNKDAIIKGYQNRASAGDATINTIILMKNYSECKITIDEQLASTKESVEDTIKNVKEMLSYSDQDKETTIKELKESPASIKKLFTEKADIKIADTDLPYDSIEYAVVKAPAETKKLLEQLNKALNDMKKKTKFDSTDRKLINSMQRVSAMNLRIQNKVNLEYMKVARAYAKLGGAKAEGEEKK